MAKPARKPTEPPAPIVEQVGLFAVPEGGGVPKHPALTECRWPLARFRVLEELTRAHAETVTSRTTGKQVQVRKTKRYTDFELSNVAGVTLDEATAAIDYFERLHLARETKRNDANGPLPSLWSITAAGKREYQRVRPIMVRRIAGDAQ